MLPALARTVGVTGIRAFTFTPADGVPPGVAPFAHATAAGQTLYVTGQMPTGPDGAVVGSDVATQTDQVLRNLLRVTELCGGGLADVVSVRAYLIDWDDYAAFNDAYAAWFPERLPSRTCVGVTRLAVGALVEIDWVCWRDDGWDGSPVPQLD
jgi:reactive intermediate/imine deaminase